MKKQVEEAQIIVDRAFFPNWDSSQAAKQADLGNLGIFSPTRVAGYARKYRQIVEEARRRFPGAPLIFSGEATPRRTGWFEVTIDDRLVYSTKKGMGKLNTNAKLDRIMGEISDALASKNWNSPS